MESQPMDYFVRKFEPAWLEARAALAKLLQADPDNLTLVENATVAMNIVAHSFPLQAGDEVVLTDHEYGAVLRTWQRVCHRVGAKVAIAEIPWPLHTEQEVVDSILGAVTERTRLVVVSHITSPTALTLPVAAIVEQAHRHGVSVCVDGPHAVAQLPLDLTSLKCDFYTASCHKWLCAPFGSGFLYVDRRWQETIDPPVTSWGRIPPREAQVWWESFVWVGTRDATAMLAIPSAIDYLSEQVGLEHYRKRSHFLARGARTRFLARWCTTAWTEDDSRWYRSMACVPIPGGESVPLQRRLWERHRVEVPIIEFQGQRLIRVSFHLYNTEQDLDVLCDALEEELTRELAFGPS